MAAHENSKRIEHTKLEFTLSLKIRRDTHIVQQFKNLSPAMPQVPPPAPPPQRGGMRSFFGGSKRPKPTRVAETPNFPIHIEENFARYLKPDGTLARAFVAFKDIAPRCDTRLFETTYPLIGQRLEAPGEGGGTGGTMVPKQVGEIVLQMFRLPPLPGIPPNDLPQSLEECHKGLRHTAWHKVTYHEGVLTQLGGDCSVSCLNLNTLLLDIIISVSDMAAQTTTSHWR